jgi:DNA-binding NarL/FixJ family response regulator
MLQVLIADSHPLARAAFQSLLEHVAGSLRDECLVSVSDDALTAFRKAKRLQPDLIILSSNLRLTGGLQDVLALRAYAPNAKVLLVLDGDETLPPGYRFADADGVLSKRDPRAKMVATLGRLLGERAEPPVTPEASS